MVSHHVPGAQLGEGAGGEPALLLADREEGGVDVQGVEHVHQLQGVGPGTIVEGERELASPMTSFGDRGGIGEDTVDRGFFGAVPPGGELEWGESRDARAARIVRGLAAGRTGVGVGCGGDRQRKDRQ